MPKFARKNVPNSKTDKNHDDANTRNRKEWKTIIIQLSRVSGKGSTLTRA